MARRVNKNGMTAKFFAVLLTLSGSFLFAADTPFTVGFADVDISPKLGAKPVYLAGFGQGRKATRIHDPIMARAVVLDDGQNKIALVTVDVVGLFSPSVERVREKLPGFRYVLVSATHNHEGPDTMGLWGPNPLTSGVDSSYLERVEAGCVDAVQKADAARKPAVAKIGTAHTPELLRDTRLPEVKLDAIVAISFRDPKSDAPIGVLVQWNCHPETLDSKNTEITADFVGYTVKRLRETQKCPVAYFTGAVGGLMTTLRLPVQDAAGRELADGTFTKAERYGTLLADAAEKAIANSVPVSLTPFEVRTRSLLLPVDNNLYRLAWKLGTLNRKLYRWDGDTTPKEFVETKDVSKPVAVKTEVGCLRLGDLEIAVIPGEIYPELVLGKVQDPVDAGADFPEAAMEPAIYPSMTSRHKMIIGLGNDELGYIIPKRQWDDKPPFCYGRKKAQYGEENSVGPETAPIICKTFRDLVTPRSP
jgi:hypothetical protein